MGVTQPIDSALTITSMESIEDHVERCASSNLDQQLWTIEYSSQFPVAGQDIDEATAIKEIDNIITAAQEKNEALGITGRLLYAIKECEVFQVLEGPKDKVVALYQTISADSRHSNVNVIHEDTITERVHSTWMGKCCMDGSARAWAELKF